MATSGRFRAYAAVVLFLALASATTAKYSGGTGEPTDPYQIATAADLIALGETPEDYDKNLLLTADLDLDPDLPGGRVFTKAVVAPFAEAPLRPLPPGAPRPTAFAGVFDGGGHTISRVTIRGWDYLGLFGRLASNAEVRNLAVVDVNVIGSRYYVGGVVGLNEGRIRACYVKGEVRGDYCVGGFAGGSFGVITACYAEARVSGPKAVGGFVGSAGGTIVRCYATGQVIRTENGDFLGGFAGEGNVRGFIDGCLWDTQASGIDISACGIGFDTAELMEPDAYSLNGWAGDPNWVLAAGQDYPRLAWEGRPGQAIGEPVINNWLAGSGTEEDPFQIATADQLALVGTSGILWDKALALTADLDVNGVQICRIGICLGSEFRGSFDGRGHTIRNLTMDWRVQSAWWVGLFGWIHDEGRVRDLNLEDAVIRGGGQRSADLGALAGSNRGLISNCMATNVLVEGQSAGGLVGYNIGSVDYCQAIGDVRGDWCVGGLIGLNHGSVLHCRADGAVSGRQERMGGLVGANVGVSVPAPGANPRVSPGDSVVRKAVIGNCCATGRVTGDEASNMVGGLAGFNQDGDITGCYATGSVSGGDMAGGLVGVNGSGCFITNSYARGDVVGHTGVGGLAGGTGPGGAITNSYARGDVVGHTVVGGLVGSNVGSVTTCYATGKAVGDEYVGGLAGWAWDATIARSFWDIQTSGLSDGTDGMGRTTGQMQTLSTFLEAGWDFVGETANGAEDIWWILEGQDYPRLWWEAQD